MNSTTLIICHHQSKSDKILPEFLLNDHLNSDIFIVSWRIFFALVGEMNT